MIRIGIFGATGRMGKAIAEALADRRDAAVVEDAPDVYVDFSAPEALEKSLGEAVAAGTGLLLGKAAAEGRGVDLDAVSDRGRDGMGARGAGHIGFAALRGGSVAGDHQVIFAGEGERIELGHRAESRSIFAQGAIRAALWLAGKPAGRYTMNDVLGLT